MQITKILSYDLYATTVGRARYQRVCAVLDQTIDPPTLAPQQLTSTQPHTLTSPRARAIGCINPQHTHITVEPALNELAFSLPDFCTEEMFLQHGSTAVREAFVTAFINNQLSTSHTKLRAELAYICSWRAQTHPPYMVSHTFRMKLLELYTLFGDALFRNPTIITQHIDTSKHLYHFGDTIHL